MFASTQDLEFVQGQSRDVPDRELGPNSMTSVFWLTESASSVCLLTEIKTCESIWHNYIAVENYLTQ